MTIREIEELAQEIVRQEREFEESIKLLMEELNETT